MFEKIWFWKGTLKKVKFLNEFENKIEFLIFFSILSLKNQKFSPLQKLNSQKRFFASDFFLYFPEKLEIDWKFWKTEKPYHKLPFFLIFRKVWMYKNSQNLTSLIFCPPQSKQQGGSFLFNFFLCLCKFRAPLTERASICLQLSPHKNLIHSLSSSPQIFSFASTDNSIQMMNNHLWIQLLTKFDFYCAKSHCFYFPRAIANEQNC